MKNTSTDGHGFSLSVGVQPPRWPTTQPNSRGTRRWSNSLAFFDQPTNGHPSPILVKMKSCEKIWWWFSEIDIVNPQHLSFTTNLVCIVCHFWDTTESCFCCFNSKIYQDSKLKPQLLGNSDPSETCPSQQLLWTKKLDGCLAKGHYKETKIQLIQTVFCKYWYFLGPGASQKQKLLRAIYEKSSFLKEIVQHLLGVQEKNI